jgi:acyl carrier protein
MEGRRTHMNQNDIMEWMRDYLAAHLKVDRERIEVDMQFEDYGLDSRTSMEMIGALAKRIGAEVDPGVIYDYSTIETLAARVAELAQESATC